MWKAHFHDFRSIKRFSIYGLEVSSRIWFPFVDELDEFTLTLNISTIFDYGNPKVTSFNLAEEAHQKEQNKKKSLKNITLITNLPLVVGTGSTKWCKNFLNYLG